MRVARMLRADGAARTRSVIEVLYRWRCRAATHLGPVVRPDLPEMSRSVALFVCLTTIGLATSARAQLTPAAPPATPSAPLTKTVFPEEPRKSRTPTETFVLEPAMSIELDDSPSGPAGFDP